ncbi:hypothetical protein SNEBB_007627 [Seison nebaliae]|nr:hypothetical protein SNEBB_007627 [Seison nebaliae]
MFLATAVHSMRIFHLILFIFPIIHLSRSLSSDTLYDVVMKHPKLEKLRESISNLHHIKAALQDTTSMLTFFAPINDAFELNDGNTEDDDDSKSNEFQYAMNKENEYLYHLVKNVLDDDKIQTEIVRKDALYNNQPVTFYRDKSFSLTIGETKKYIDLTNPFGSIFESTSCKDSLWHLYDETSPLYQQLEIRRKNQIRLKNVERIRKKVRISKRPSFISHRRSNPKDNKKKKKNVTVKVQREILINQGFNELYSTFYKLFTVNDALVCASAIKTKNGNLYLISKRLKIPKEDNVFTYISKTPSLSKLNQLLITNLSSINTLYQHFPRTLEQQGTYFLPIDHAMTTVLDFFLYKGQAKIPEDCSTVSLADRYRLGWKNITFDTIQSLTASIIPERAVFTENMMNDTQYETFSDPKYEAKKRKIYFQRYDDTILVISGNRRCKIVNGNIMFRTSVIHLIDCLLDFTTETMTVTMDRHARRFLSFIHKLGSPNVRNILSVFPNPIINILQTSNELSEEELKRSDFKNVLEMKYKQEEHQHRLQLINRCKEQMISRFRMIGCEQGCHITVLAPSADMFDQIENDTNLVKNQARVDSFIRSHIIRGAVFTEYNDQIDENYDTFEPSVKIQIRKSNVASYSLTDKNRDDFENRLLKLPSATFTAFNNSHLIGQSVSRRGNYEASNGVLHIINYPLIKLKMGSIWKLLSTANDYSTMFQRLKALGYDRKLRDVANGQSYTIFVPNDEAFSQIYNTDHHRLRDSITKRHIYSQGEVSPQKMGNSKKYSLLMDDESSVMLQFESGSFTRVKWQNIVLPVKEEMRADNGIIYTLDGVLIDRTKPTKAFYFNPNRSLMLKNNLYLLILIQPILYFTVYISANSIF